MIRGEDQVLEIQALRDQILQNIQVMFFKFWKITSIINMFCSNYLAKN